MTGQGRMDIGQLRGQEARKHHGKVQWYQGYSGRGKADTLIEGLSRYVQSRRLTDTVCGLRVERRPKGEFYFFLTLETDYEGVLPDDIRETLEECPFLKFGAGGPYDLETIRTMVSGELKMKALGQCITYRVLRQEQADDPFRAEPEVGPGTLGVAAERLLWYLSALGGGAWSTFHSACAALGVGDASRRLARTLRLLGHLEVSGDGDRWSVTPETVVEVTRPGDEPLRYLTGARAPHSGGQPDLQLDAPARVQAADDHGLSVITDPALALTERLPTLAEFRRGLPLVGGISAVRHHFARFDGLTFRPGPLTGEPGLYEVTAEGGRTLTLLHGGGTDWRRGDWYGLRYLTLSEAELLVDGQYDPDSRQLALPADQRPPELYERALVLCSGLMPTERDRWLVYQNVSPVVAARLAALLQVRLVTHEVAA
ncbi:hypothetical protein [Deinococcus arcticus]|uniref:hypothetical protein n=1 Tax=Deinococcus arcticus TaxID=2136176 RepID=UPI001304BFFE|nr:hypothetical protein [Deinococcus arcticus]